MQEDTEVNLTTTETSSETQNQETKESNFYLGQRLMYFNRGSDHLRGKSWVYIERSPFAGTVVTGENRRKLIYEKALEYQEKNPGAPKEECLEWGKRWVNKETKHFKSYLKGKNSYSYKGGKYLVEDQSRVELFKKIAAEQEAAQKEREENEKRAEEDSKDNK